MSQLFTYQSHSVRAVTENNEIWFAAVDVCRALGISWSGRKILRGFPEDWQRVVKLATLRRGEQEAVVISEPAVYKLAFRSNKPEADAFTNWVASEVLPAIRKTGKFENAPRKKRLERSGAKRAITENAGRAPKKWTTLSEYTARINTLAADAELKANESIKALSDLGYALLWRPVCLDPEVHAFGKALERNLPGLSFAAQTSVKALCDMVSAYLGGLTSAQK